MRYFYVIVVWLHLLAAAAWIGGMTFISLVLVPSLRDAELAAHRVALLRETGRRFRRVGWIAVSTLLATGVALLAWRGVGAADLASRAFWASSFGRILAVKLALVAALLALSAVHDFWLGPRANLLLQADPTSPRGIRLRRAASRCGRANLVLALAVLALAAMLARGVS
jgi:putative copper export protein